MAKYNTVPVERTVNSKQCKSIQRRTPSSNERLNVEESAASKKNGQSESSMDVYVRNTQSWRKVQGSNKRAQFIESDWRLSSSSFFPSVLRHHALLSRLFLFFSTIDVTTQIPGDIDIDELANVRQLNRGGRSGDKRRRASRLGHGE